MYCVCYLSFFWILNSRITYSDCRISCSYSSPFWTLTKFTIKNKEFNDNLTFIQLYEKTNIELLLTATCINDKKLYLLSHKTFIKLEMSHSLSSFSLNDFKLISSLIICLIICLGMFIYDLNFRVNHMYLSILKKSYLSFVNLSLIL